MAEPEIAKTKFDFTEHRRSSEELQQLFDRQKQVAIWDYRFVNVAEVNADEDRPVLDVGNHHDALRIGCVDRLEYAIFHHTVDFVF